MAWRLPTAAISSPLLLHAIDNFLRLVASPAGRAARIALGTGLIGTGLALGREGWALSALGLVPLAMSAFDCCLLEPLNGLPFNGPQVRAIPDPGPADSDQQLAPNPARRLITR